MRLNKFLAESGICSRRQADAWIAEGRVSINGQVAELGTPVTPADNVTVDDKKINRRMREHVYIAFNKPVGVTCTTEARVPDNIIDFIGHPERIFPIGRLDKDSEGLILLTSDGDIVNTLLRAENEHEKEYIVRVNGPLHEKLIASMREGVYLSELGVTTKPCKIVAESKTQFRIILTQGLNRQIRRMCAHHGLEVRSLQRVRFGNVVLGNIQVGFWRELTAGEKQVLLAVP